MTFENGIARAAARMMDRRKFVVLSAAAAFSAALELSGCASGEGAKGADASDGAVEFTATTESRDLMGSAEPCDVRVGLIMGRRPWGFRNSSWQHRRAKPSITSHST